MAAKVPVAPAPTVQRSTDPYVLLAAAVLKQALFDAQGRGGYGWRPEYQVDAERFLRSTECLDGWVALCGGDTAYVQQILLAHMPRQT
jgi:hypothetical protein